MWGFQSTKIDIICRWYKLILFWWQSETTSGYNGKRNGTAKYWFDLNKLTLNLRKTKCVVFGNRLSNKIGKWMINEVEIERVSAITFLGVIIDNNLNWKGHLAC